MKQSKNIILFLRKDTTSAYLSVMDFFANEFNFFKINSISLLNHFYDKKIKIILVPYAHDKVENVNEKIKFIKYHLDKDKYTILIRYFHEYNLSDNKAFLDLYKEIDLNQVYILTNFVKIKKFEKFKNYHYFNFNCLKFEDINVDFEKYKKFNKPLYYGTFRERRKKYFDIYFKKNFLISSAPKSLKKFMQFYPKNIFLNRLKFFPFPQLIFFKYSLYIEDIFTHSHYNFPANRFYECLSYGVVQFFDVNCLNTFKTYNLDISDFIVENYDDLMKRIKKANYKRLWEKQKKWREKAKEDLNKLKKDIEEYLKNLQ